MCGISGIIGKEDSSGALNRLEEMNELVNHRGPDGTGIYIDPLERLGFGHKRLAILDLSEAGHQPMFSSCESLVIVFNGEIYNYLELRAELGKKGHNFKTGTDTEVILASYIEWGAGCVSKFNGMWAFAIYDTVSGEVFCSRDRFGVKPFYYTLVDDKFVFGSEIKQLLLFRDQNYVNKKVLMDYLVTGYENHNPETFFESIYELKGSHNLVFSLETNSFELFRYYDLKPSIIKSSHPSEITEKSEYKMALDESVKLRLRSDVMVGTCLSGGLDSSSIASLAAEQLSKDGKVLTAIHAKSSMKDSDESEFAIQVSQFCGLDLNVIEPSVAEFEEVLNDVIMTQEEPFGGPSVVMQYFVMKKSKELNCKVLLDGQGGDETLLGYERYFPAYILGAGFIKSIKYFFSSWFNSRLTLTQLIAYIGYFPFALVRIKRLERVNSFIKPKYLKLFSRKALEESARSYRNIFNLQHNEIFKVQMPHLLRYEDKNSMRHSVETRLPFVDYKVVEAAVSSSIDVKIRDGWTKWILREAVQDCLPASIVWRKNKMGFEAPTKLWLQSIHDKMVESVEDSNLIGELCNDFDFDKLNDVQQWKLFNLAKWEKLFDVRIK
jgi:asparagine synthase (glutamine-hydrolysing)